MIPDWNSIAEHCNLWRTYHDIHSNWKDILATIDFVGDNQEIFNRNAGPGRWNDPDMVLLFYYLFDFLKLIIDYLKFFNKAFNRKFRSKCRPIKGSNGNLGDNRCTTLYVI